MAFEEAFADFIREAFLFQKSKQTKQSRYNPRGVGIQQYPPPRKEGIYMKKVIALMAAAVSFSLMLAGCSSKGEMELGNYKGVETAYTVNATEEDIDAAIREALAAKGEQKEITGRAVQNGDITNIDYEGLKDGVAFERGTAQGYDLEIGSGMFIPGFEDGVIGMNVGETRAIDLTFPENYQATDLAGQKVVFNVKLNSIKELVPPELTDELAQELSGKNTIAEYREYVKENLIIQQKYMRESDLWNTVMNSTKIVSYPEAEVKKNIDQMTNSTAVQAEAQGMTLDSYLEAMQVTRTDFDANIKQMAEQTVAQNMVTEAIVKAENLTVTEEQRKEIISTLLLQSNVATEEELIKNYTKEVVDQVVLQQRVMSYISEMAVDMTA